MILTVAAVVTLGALGYAAYKHYGTAAIQAAVSAELVKVEAEASAVGSKLSADTKAAYTAVAARVKAVLAKL